MLSTFANAFQVVENNEKSRLTLDICEKPAEDDSFNTNSSLASSDKVKRRQDNLTIVEEKDDHPSEASEQRPHKSIKIQVVMLDRNHST